MAGQTVKTDFEAQFNKVHALPSAERPAAYGALLNQICTDGPTKQNLTAYLISLLGSDSSIQGVTPAADSLNIIALRPLLASYIECLKSLPPASNDLKLEVSRAAIDIIQPRVASFEDADYNLKLCCADACEADEDFQRSAQILNAINFDTSSRNSSDTEKASIWVRIARCFLEIDDPTRASGFINRAKNVMHNINDPQLRLLFHSAQARILDSQRAFLDASTAYHTLSFEPIVDEDDRLQALSAAMTCAVLAPAGPQRGRVLARLYKDDRAAQIPEYPILEKIFLDRILGTEEVAQFAAKLLPHQRATTSDGSTVLDRAVLEHNLLGASKLYQNIGIDQLGALLGVDGDRAEQYAAGMIEQGRLSGHIDQIDGVIFFDATESGSGGSTTGGQQLRRWDRNVLGLAEEVEKVTTMIQTEFPIFYAQNMAA